MKIWLAKNSEVSVREQLITQISMAIASGDLDIEEKLPSTKEISRRFQIHANTVSNAYQELVEQGWLEFRQGSGFFVKEFGSQNFTNPLDQIIVQFLQTAQKQGFKFAEIKKRLSQFFDFSLPNHFLIIESDLTLQEILITEIAEATNFKVLGITFEDFQVNPNLQEGVFVALFDETEKIRKILPANKTCIFLQTTSVVESLKGQMRPQASDLIAIVSGWSNFLLMAKTVLLAAQIEAESLLIRSTSEANWQEGLNHASIIICDSLTAKNFPNDERIRPFRIISNNSLTEISSLLT